MGIINRAANALTIQLGGAHVTFWQRAAASIGVIEGWRTERFYYLQILAWGYMVGIHVDVAPCMYWPGYYKGFRVGLPWADYHR